MSEKRQPETPEFVRKFNFHNQRVCPFCRAWLLPNDGDVCPKCGAVKQGKFIWLRERTDAEEAGKNADSNQGR